MNVAYIKYIFWTALVALIAVMIAFVVYFVRQFSAPGYTIRTDGASVVTELQKLNRLETASFTIEKIIEAGTNGNAFQEWLYGDRILLIAHGQVIAGFELSNLSTDDIKISGTTITLTLPKPSILTTRLDNTQTRVYDRSKGFLTSGDKNLESKARAAAEDSIRTAACTEHILTVASENGQQQLEALLRGFGFTNITVKIPEGSCS